MILLTRVTKILHKKIIQGKKRMKCNFFRVREAHERFPISKTKGYAGVKWMRSKRNRPPLLVLVQTGTTNLEINLVVPQKIGNSSISSSNEK